MLLKISNRGPSVAATSLRIDTDELSRWLKAVREHQGFGLDEVADRLVELENEDRIKLAWLLPPDQKDRLAVERKLRQLENSNNYRARTKDEVFPLLEAYGMSRVMLGALIGDPTGDVCMKANLSEFIPIGETGSGRNCAYFFPARRLRDTDPVFALLALGSSADSCSDCHSHPGTELLMPLSGRAELVFPGSGLSTTLEEGDLAHFAAHEPHFVRGLGRATKIFVARCAQLHKGGILRRRLDSIAAFRRELKQSRPNSGKQLARIRTIFQEQLEPWFTQVTSNQTSHFLSSANRHPMEVRDPVGCGRLIQNMCDLRGISIDGLLDRMALDKVKQHRVSRDHLWKLRRGMVVPTKADLEAHSRALDLPMVLFAPYFFEPQPIAAIIKRNSKEHLASLDPGLFGLHQGVDYRMPTRILADSDVAFLMLHLERSASTDWNSHTGHEVLIVLESSVELTIKSNDALLRWTATPGDILHFDATLPHRVVGLRGRAKVMVLRFLEFFDSERKSVGRIHRNIR